MADAQTPPTKSPQRGRPLLVSAHRGSGTRWPWLFAHGSFLLFLLASAASGAPITFAAIGDFGSDYVSTRQVAQLVKSWQPQFIITLGDNNYPSGALETIDRNVGQFYHEFISPYPGRYGAGAVSNRFFPCLGNHDWIATNAQPYLDYFTL